MLEMPEAINIAKQLGSTIVGKTINNVITEKSPHKLAWFYGDKEKYSDLLTGKKIDGTESFGALVSISAGDIEFLFGDGVNIRFFESGSKLPAKHQLLVEFDDGTSIVCSIAMYGGLGAFVRGTLDNKYYQMAKEKPSPLTDAFDYPYFKSLITGNEKKSAKAFLATEQRIPGIGNGVLQDILFNARIHPKRKIQFLSDSELKNMFDSVKNILSEITKHGGRDTEKDIFGKPGGYKTLLSAKTYKDPCPICGGDIIKQAYLGGSVYYCPSCQKE